MARAVSAETRAKIGETQRALWTPEKRAAHSARMKASLAQKKAATMEGRLPDLPLSLTKPTGDRLYNQQDHVVRVITNMRRVITYQHGLDASTENIATDAYEWIIACLDSGTNEMQINLEWSGDAWSFTLTANNLEVVE